jgi:hypothetical protein
MPAAGDAPERTWRRPVRNYLDGVCAFILVERLYWSAAACVVSFGSRENEARWILPI